MVFRMARPTKRSNSANAQFRQRVPSDLIERLRGEMFVATLLPASAGEEPVEVRTKIGDTITFSLRTSERAVYNARHAAAQQLVNAFFEAARRGPADLSFKQINALCGELYKHLTISHEDNPPEDFALDVMTDLVEDAERFLRFGTASGRQKAVDVLRRWVDLDLFLSEMAARHGVSLSEHSRREFLEAMPDTLGRALQTLSKRRAANYEEDTTVARYARLSPSLSQPQRVPGGGIQTFDELFEKWKASGNHAPATITRWRGIMSRFKAFVGPDNPQLITEADAERWKDDLLAAGLKRIDMSFIAAMRRLYGCAIESKATTGITFNPFTEVKAGQKEEPGTGRQTFTAVEAATILAASQRETAAYLRWLPWLQAATGARVAELAQLWGSMVINQDGIPCIQIAPTPDGGRVKNVGSERIIPIHPKLIEDGFLKFVEQRGKGPLFYGGSKARPAAPGSDEQKHPSKGVTNRLAAWVRGLGITDPRKAPNHAWRRWMKRELNRTGTSDRLADAIQGHAPRNEGDKYYDAELSDMHAAISKIDLEAAASFKPGE